MAHHKRSRRNQGLKDAISVITSAALVVIAILLVLFVYLYIRDSSEGSLISSLFGRKETVPEASSAEPTAYFSDGEENSDFTITVDGERYGLQQLSDGRIVYVLSPAELETADTEHRLKTADGHTVLMDAWTEIAHQLYYFGSDGSAATGNFSEGAFTYTFDETGAARAIRYNPSYRPDTSASSAAYPGLIQTKTLWAYLNESKTLGGFAAIQYKKTTESLSHQLGGSANPQYASPYAMAVEGGYIYYLAYTSDPTEILDAINNKLFRMRPGAEIREIVAEGVRGFKVITGADGGAVVYYDDGSLLHRTVSFAEDETVLTFPEDGVYTVDIDTTPGKAVLMLDGTHPVALETDSFTAGNFIYRLSASGEILSVQPKTSVSIGGFTYSIESGEAFGASRSRIIRQDGAGTIEVISTEFLGSAANVHYDYRYGEMFAEYTDQDGFGGILRFSKDGDVDILTDAAGFDGSYRLIGIQDNSVIVRRESAAGAVSYAKLRARISTPIALAMDPQVLEEDDPDPDTVIEDPAVIIAPGSEGMGQDAGNIGPGGPGGPGDPAASSARGEEYDIAVAGQPTTAAGEAEIIYGPGGSSSLEVNIINNNAGAEQIGPGNDPQVGGMP